MTTKGKALHSIWQQKQTAGIILINCMWGNALFTLSLWRATAYLPRLNAYTPNSKRCVNKPFG